MWAKHPLRKKSIYPSNTIHPLIATLCFISHMPFEYITNTISIVQYPTNAMLHISSWLQGWRMDGMGRMLCDLWWWKQEENKGGRPTTRERRKCVPKSGGNRPVQYAKMPRCSLTIWPFDFHHSNISINQHQSVRKKLKGTFHLRLWLYITWNKYWHQKNWSQKNLSCSINRCV